MCPNLSLWIIKLYFLFTEKKVFDFAMDSKKVITLARLYLVFMESDENLKISLNYF